MSFDWHDYWELAEHCRLQANTTSFAEAFLRSSISRAYYSIFCSARNLTRTRGIMFPEGNEHKQVRLYFQEETDPIEQQLGSDLNKLRNHRNKADYEDAFPGNLEKTAEYVTGVAHKMHSTIAKLPK